LTREGLARSAPKTDEPEAARGSRCNQHGRGRCIFPEFLPRKQVRHELGGEFGLHLGVGADRHVGGGVPPAGPLDPGAPRTPDPKTRQRIPPARPPNPSPPRPTPPPAKPAAQVSRPPSLPTGPQSPLRPPLATCHGCSAHKQVTPGPVSHRGALRMAVRSQRAGFRSTRDMTKHRGLAAGRAVSVTQSCERAAKQGFELGGSLRVSGNTILSSDRRWISLDRRILYRSRIKKNETGRHRRDGGSRRIGRSQPAGDNRN